MFWWYLLSCMYTLLICISRRLLTEARIADYNQDFLTASHICEHGKLAQVGIVSVISVTENSYFLGGYCEKTMLIPANQVHLKYYFFSKSLIACWCKKCCMISFMKYEWGMLVWWCLNVVWPLVLPLECLAYELDGEEVPVPVISVRSEDVALRVQ